MHCQGNKINGDQMGGGYVELMKEMRNAYTIFVKRTNVEKQRWREGGII
jgi:hypothetical protein